MASFHQRLRELRKEKGVSLDEIANSIDGVAKGSLSRYENKKSEPGINTAIKLANYFNCSLDYLLGRSNYKNAEALIEYKDENEVNEAIDILEDLADNLTTKKINDIYHILDIVKKYKDSSK